jgi:malonate transporter and related proteins
MLGFQHFVGLTAPLFLLVFLGFALARWARWPHSVSEGLSKFVFSTAIPALLFRLMSDFSRLPPVDARLLVAFFGGCVAVFALGRVVAWLLFRMDGTAQSVFAMGGVFANNVLLGVPLAKVTLGDAAMPSISLVLVFNALILWTLVTMSVEWARTRSASLAGIAKTARNVLTNPVVASILAGTAWSFVGIPLPRFVDDTLSLVASSAIPMSLIALGMTLGEYGVTEGWRESVAITAMKLVAHPLAVYAIARAMALPALETQTVVMLATLPVGANVYLMSREFKTLQAPVASSLVLSTAVAALTTPLALALLGASA